MHKILVCDDDKEIVSAIEIYLKDEGYEVVKAYDGQEAIKILEDYPDILLMIIDIMMPNIDGLSATKQIRKISSIPIIMLSAKVEGRDKIKGLKAGADDYISKPFNPMELVARVNAQIRRFKHLGSAEDKSGSSICASGELVINDELKEVRVSDKVVRLTPIEYNILLFLLKNKGKVFSVEEIYNNIWHEEAIGADNTVAVHIRHIREKVEVNPKEPYYLKVVWGIGYKIEQL